MTDARTRPLPNPWLVLATLLVVYVFNLADRYLITGLIGPIKHEFGLGDGFMGLLMGPAFVLLYVLLGVPIARIADRGSRVRIIAIGCILWSLCTMATGLATGPVTLALSRIGVGIGEAAFIAPAWSLIADYFPVGRRATAFSIIGLATYIGQIAGQGGGPAIAAEYGWRSAFFLMGAPGLVLGGLTVLLIRDPPRELPATGPAQAPLRAVLGELTRTPAYLLMIGAYGLGTLSGIAFGYWGPELFTRAYAMDPVAAKSAFAFNFGLAGLVGMLAFGAIADRLTKRGIAWPMRLTAMALFAATLLTLGVTWLGSFSTAILLAIPSGLLGGGWSVGVQAMLQHILPGRHRATGSALFNAVTTLLGYFVGPWLTGTISGALGNDLHSLRIGLSVTIPMGIAGALLAWLASSRIAAMPAQVAEAKTNA